MKTGTVDFYFSFVQGNVIWNPTTRSLIQSNQPRLVVVIVHKQRWMDTREGCALQHGGSQPRPTDNNGIIVNNRVIDTLLLSAPQDYISRQLIILFLIEFECYFVIQCPWLPFHWMGLLGKGKDQWAMTPVISYIFRIWALKPLRHFAALRLSLSLRHWHQVLIKITLIHILIIIRYIIIWMTILIGHLKGHTFVCVFSRHNEHDG